MIKQKISSKLLQARTLAIYELDEFIDYIRAIDPELQNAEVHVLVAFILNGLPELFKGNVDLVNQVKEIAKKMKLKRDRR